MNERRLEERPRREQMIHILALAGVWDHFLLDSGSGLSRRHGWRRVLVWFRFRLFEGVIILWIMVSRVQVLILLVLRLGMG